VSERAALTYVREVVGRLRRVVDDDELLGAYVIGSLALGGYEPERSDVDVAAIVDGPLSSEEKQAVVAACRHESLPCPVRKLELVVYARERAPAFELNLNTGGGVPLHAGFDPAAEPSFWFVLDVAIARASGLAVLGPAPAVLFPQQSRDVIVASAREALAWSIAEAPVDDVVLNAARTRRFLDEGVWSSKAAAGQWALEHLADDREAVRAALAVRRGDAGAALSRERAAAFAASLAG
jgi:hypothetical protein